jgi:hypothetical protein
MYLAGGARWCRVVLVKYRTGGTMKDTARVQKRVTFEYDAHIVTLIALDHLEKEYQGYLARSDVAGNIDFWTSRLVAIAVTRKVIEQGDLILTSEARS